jgi:hypothetical protein
LGWTWHQEVWGSALPWQPTDLANAAWHCPCYAAGSSVAHWVFAGYPIPVRVVPTAMWTLQHMAHFAMHCMIDILWIRNNIKERGHLFLQNTPVSSSEFPIIVFSFSNQVSILSPRKWQLSLITSVSPFQANQRSSLLPSTFILIHNS